MPTIRPCCVSASPRSSTLVDTSNKSLPPPGEYFKHAYLLQLFDFAYESLSVNIGIGPNLFVFYYRWLVFKAVYVATDMLKMASDDRRIDIRAQCIHVDVGKITQGHDQGQSQGQGLI